MNMASSFPASAPSPALPMAGASQLLIGHVIHQRVRPVLHRFRYPVFYVRLNLARIEQEQSVVFGLNRWRPLSLFYRDYGPRDGSALLPWIRNLLDSEQIAADGDIYLQTFPRIFGYAFNPVSFWYCHNRLGELLAVLVEVNNTFGEHIHYLLRSNDGASISEKTLYAGKQMHVSPFCQVKGHYQFQFRNRAALEQVKIDYTDVLTQGVLIHTAISGQCQPFNRRNLWAALVRQPLLTVGVVWRIHWQALLLWKKRVPFFRHGRV